MSTLKYSRVAVPCLGMIHVCSCETCFFFFSPSLQAVFGKVPGQLMVGQINEDSKGTAGTGALKPKGLKGVVSTK